MFIRPPLGSWVDGERGGQGRTATTQPPSYLATLVGARILSQLDAATAISEHERGDVVALRRAFREPADRFQQLLEHRLGPAAVAPGHRRHQPIPPEFLTRVVSRLGDAV